jgi:hypothetical protein
MQRQASSNAEGPHELSPEMTGKSAKAVLASRAHIGSHPPQHFSQGPPIITGLIFHEAAQFAFGDDPELLKYD